ncbi:MAG: hypothetical protein U1A78_17050 [Polyangia bacterium]
MKSWVLAAVLSSSLTSTVPLLVEAPRARAGAPSPQGTLDAGPVERGANAVLLVSCDCGAMEIYLDGQLYNSQQGSFRITDLGSGTHALKIMGWPHPFKRSKYFEGAVNLHANTETRIQVGKDGASVLGKSPVAPPPPPPRVAGERTYAEIDASMELLQDAQELAREDRCGRRLDEKFQALLESLRWVRENVSADNLAGAAQKTHDVVEYAQDACSPRTAAAVGKKLARVRQRLDGARRTVD